MKVALIAPKGLHAFSSYGDMQFIVPENVVEDYYAGSIMYKMLDNGTYERSLPLDAESFVALARKLQVDEIVLPDVILAAHAPVRTSREFIDGHKQGTTKYAAVPQARSPLEWIKAYNTMSAWDEVDVLCIPIWLQKRFGRRAAIIHKLVRDGHWSRDKQHHLIGLDGYGELMHYYPWVAIRSVDTSLPFSRALAGQVVTFEDSKISRASMNIDHVSPTIEAIIMTNIRTLLEVAHKYA